MMEKFRHFIKGVVAISLLFGTISGAVYASPELTAVMGNGGSYEAHMTHDYSNSRYCEMAIMTGSTFSSATTVGFASGILSPNTAMYIQRQVNGQYGYAVGTVYNSTVPHAGIAWSSHTQDLNPNYP